MAICALVCICVQWVSPETQLCYTAPWEKGAGFHGAQLATVNTQLFKGCLDPSWVWSTCVNNICEVNPETPHHALWNISGQELRLSMPGRFSWEQDGAKQWVQLTSATKLKGQTTSTSTPGAEAYTQSEINGTRIPSSLQIGSTKPSHAIRFSHFY